jgi:dihydrofolate reductase
VKIPVAMIAAVAENGVIGSGNAIPWRLPTDFAHFKRTTMGKPVIMGRKTFESIGKPLPGRSSIVVTRRPGYRPDGVIVAGSLKEALERAGAVAASEDAGEIMVGGGGEIYREAMPLADRLYITHVALSPEGDVTFPEIDMAVWGVAEELPVVRTDRDNAAFRVKVYERRQRSVR